MLILILLGLAIVAPSVAPPGDPAELLLAPPPAAPPLAPPADGAADGAADLGGASAP